MTEPYNILIADNGSLEWAWPYTRERFEEQLRPVARIAHLDLRRETIESADWPNIDAVALFAGDLNESILDRAPRLRAVGGITDAMGPGCFALLAARGIPFIDATAAWAPSVAECGFGLMLSALRRLPHWHARLRDGSFDWNFPFVQFCDDPDFVNGELGTKIVGVVGLGQIGSRIAQWSAAFGARVIAYDPFAPDTRFADSKASRRDIDTLVAESEILVIAVPPTPSAQNLINAQRVQQLRRGAIVVTITRTDAIETTALRRRVLASELFWAADVFDVEPLPPGDPILNRANLVHVPHIAGRTRDANHRLADILADDFRRVLADDPPRFALTPEAVRIRRG